MTTAWHATCTWCGRRRPLTVMRVCADDTATCMELTTLIENQRSRYVNHVTWSMGRCP